MVGRKRREVGRKSLRCYPRTVLCREKIIALLSEDGTLTMAALARRTGITPKAVEKQIARLKADGILERIGPDKGGRWHIVK